MVLQIENQQQTHIFYFSKRNVTKYVILSWPIVLQGMEHS